MEVEPAAPGGRAISLAVLRGFLLMLPGMSDKMLDDHGPVYLVRCTGTHEGAPCPALLALELTQKTECPVCHRLLGPWSSYLAQRTRTKIG